MSEPWLAPYLDRMEELSRQFFRYFHGRIEAAGGLSPSQFWLLKVLEKKGPQTVTDMAVCLGMTAAGVTGLVDRLLRGHLVTRRRDEADRRIVWVELTTQGHEAIEAARHLRREILGEVFGNFSPAEMEQLVTLYEKASRSMVAAPSDPTVKE
ncbi:MAG TPA: MarR family transcriptional regulator [Symbiobacteriaceae bacterium]|nr:MarR family transcriptional regulator [Symbiobacteriaceae bacterium]